METSLVLRLCSALTLVYLASGASRQQLVTVSWEARENRLIAHNDTNAKDIIAVCVFSDSRLDFGWSSVYVKTDGRFKDSQQAYAAGYAEGTATSRMADQHYANMYGHYCDTDPAFCSRLFAFYRANLRSLLENAIQYGDRDPFWHQVELAVLQISGMQRGLTGAKSIPYDPYEMPTDFERLVLLNLYKDIGDLEWALGRRGPKAPRDPGVAFFKTTSNNDEAIAAHTSWGHYGAMNKLLKQYVFNYKLLASSGQPVPATVVTFSGYPGGVSSGDDFFLTSTNLVVLGTGVRNQNSDLWSRLTPNNSVPSAFRSLAASRLSRSAKEWIHTYSRSSGGTGNSQWTVIDYNLFKRKVKILPRDFVWYHEELPGYSMSADVTSLVQTKGYWASYNIPFFPTIFNASGMARLAAEYGDWFTYDRCPRALMFKRGFKDPRDTERVLDFLRYNNYENDPLAVCAACNPKYNAENALSARSDLNPSVGRYPFFEMGLRPHGGTDAKVVNSTMMARHSLWTQCGPTWYEKQAFSWSSSPFASVPHVGQPDNWNFPPALKEWPDHVTLNSSESPSLL
ncbi:putative phospholipase B-like 2 isoform X2 [Dermacentor variabilis]|uniref:putative phospholipase B-like 2 isoform X2 n=1 Tax=Dermacentor variabilis TaxID=34621 RepID=UPI003F5BCA71